ncbi:phospho-sugar mutase [Sporosarcina sp. ANT_H38]|uniref:phospho-sugar mutase n=1 Tax=Sporosarcina sp. ANT_H38 TaxID=2597358 RepID=UPI0011F3044C|nr:phospho-sugar mutase [Sporosarcina sp. ANT_H38]KAA0955542.1 phospho-sugar mutase [Sporosarcina sp. ANT_H38]
MQWKSKLNQWIEQLPKEDSLRLELLRNLHDEKLMEDSFYKELAFGTGGMRGIIGPGTNRMNIYTVRKVAAGLSHYIVEQGKDAKDRGVVIAYDSRHMSPKFALEVAKTVGSQGIKVYLFDELHPTPVLSFAVRYLHALAGIVITASHNPPEYNGLKIYAEDGAQLPPDAADIIVQQMNKIDCELTIEVSSEDKLIEEGFLTTIGEQIDHAYNDALGTILLSQKNQDKELSIVYTALHGTGNKPVRIAFSSYGFTNVTIVKEQENSDPDFSTVQFPNPEEHAAFELAIQYGKKVDADVLLATDPDADRLGVAVKNESGDYVVLTGNQTGALMLHYLLEQKQNKGNLPANGVVMKTIVTSELGRKIASNFGMKTIDTLTGFKFIAEKINEFEQTNEYSFLFGYEESYGYLIGDFVRDKDAVQSAVFVAEVAAHYKSQGKTLYEGLMDLFERFGYHQESTRSVTLTGKDGAQQIERILASFRNHPPTDVNGVAVAVIEDYAASETLEVVTGLKTAIELPKSNVLKYKLTDGSWFCIRPSGTEPKCKVYFSVTGESMESSSEKLVALENAVMGSLQKK